MRLRGLIPRGAGALCVCMMLWGCRAFVSAPGPLPMGLPSAKETVAAFYEGGEWERQVSAVVAEATAYLEKHLEKHVRPVIVLDIDDTALSTYEYQKGMGFGHNGKLWHQWIGMRRCTAITPVLSFCLEARKRGVLLFFISGRREKFRKATEANLRSAGYPEWEQLYMKPDEYSEPSVVPYKTSMREKIEGDGYDIIVNMGDQASDLKGGHALGAFLLPNLIYEVK